MTARPRDTRPARGPKAPRRPPTQPAGTPQGEADELDTYIEQCLAAVPRPSPEVMAQLRDLLPPLATPQPAEITA